jgi:hypothetical protein
MALIVYRHETRLLAFCGEFCMHSFQRSVSDDPGPLKAVDGPQPDVVFGCWWCGGDLTTGLEIQWLS